MLPFLRDADFDGALAIALRRIDAAATPENAARLELGRQFNAVLGLVGAPVVLLGLVGWAWFSWRRFGKDPVYLDDPSILMPAPPPELTAASGAFVIDGGASRRALTTAMLDLASRGALAFREDRGILGLSDKVGIDVEPPAGDAVEEARRARNARRPISAAEEYALKELRQLGAKKNQFIDADDLPEFGTSVSSFDSKLEAHVVKRGWMVEKPSKVVARWTGKGVVALVAGVVALIVGFSVPMSGLVLIGGAAILGGIFITIVAQSMPSVTMAGAMIRAMLAAYRRTLHKTMEQARSMQQVVDGAGLSWLETPDQAVVWGTALGLQDDIENVLKRSLEDVKDSPTLASSTYFPTWYTTSDGSSFAEAGAAGRGGSIFSGSAVPNLGGMMSALGTIGNAPSSSGGAVAAGSAAARRAVAAAGPAAASSEPQIPNRSRHASRPSIATVGRGRDRQPSTLIRNRWVSRATPSGASDPRPLSSYPSPRETAFEAALSRNADDSATRAPRPSKAKPRIAPRISLPRPWPWYARPIHEPVSTVRWTANSVPEMPCVPTMRPSARATRCSVHAASLQLPRMSQW